MEPSDIHRLEREREDDLKKHGGNQQKKKWTILDGLGDRYQD
jgi:hypothetical protein